MFIAFNDEYGLYYFRMTPEQALAGVTRNAAKALGLDDRGVLKVGARADIAHWQISHPAQLSYQFGVNKLLNLWIWVDLVRSYFYVFLD